MIEICTLDENNEASPCDSLEREQNEYGSVLIDTYLP